MPIPAAYSETEVKSYMASLLGPVADALGWTVVGNSFDEPLIDTLLSYGVADIADATDIPKLRALAAVAVWRAAQQAAAGLITWSTFGDKYELGSLQERIAKSLALAESRATAYDESLAAVVTPMRYANDPYRVTTLDSDL